MRTPVPPPDSNQAAERFYKELRGDLLTLVGLPMGTDMGFFDTDGLQPAVRWRDELADALGTCQVLVALLSVPYLKSDWCGQGMACLHPATTGSRDRGRQWSPRIRARSCPSAGLLSRSNRRQQWADEVLDLAGREHAEPADLAARCTRRRGSSA